MTPDNEKLIQDFRKLLRKPFSSDWTTERERKIKQLGQMISGNEIVDGTVGYEH